MFHVSARTVATQALSIFGDHSDVMACRQTGFAMLAESNVQEVMDLSAVAHLSAIKGRMPFINFFDGFRTSHEVQKIAVWDYDDLAEMCDMDAVRAFRDHALNPERPAMRGSHENGDIFFQHREACNGHYDALPAVVEDYMHQVNAKLGTDYQLFNYYGAPDADRVIVAMGSFCDVAEEVIDYLNAHGEKVGLVKVRLYRPFVSSKFVEALPATVQQDRRHGPHEGAGRPRRAAVHGRDQRALRSEGRDGLTVVGGRYGLGSKDTPPASVFAVYDGAGEGRTAPRVHRGHRGRRDATCRFPKTRTARTRRPRAPSSASSGASAATARWARTRTPSRSSATTPTNTCRPTSSTTRRRPAA